MNAPGDKLPQLLSWACLCLMVFPIGGCGPYGRVGRSYEIRQANLTVALPEGWLRYHGGRPDFVMTRDGLRLESISIAAHKLGEKLEGTERSYRRDMLPHELAELAVGLIEAQDDIRQFDLDVIELASVAGLDGYKASATYVDAARLRHRLLLYGFAVGDHVCEFWYRGADVVYYDKHLPVFLNMLESIRIAGGASASR